MKQYLVDLKPSGGLVGMMARVFLARVKKSTRAFTNDRKLNVPAAVPEYTDLLYTAAKAQRDFWVCVVMGWNLRP